MDDITIMLFIVTVALFVVAWVKRDARGLYFIDMIMAALGIGAVVYDTTINSDMLQFAVLALVTIALMDIAAFVSKPNIEV